MKSLVVGVIVKNAQNQSAANLHSDIWRFAQQHKSKFMTYLYLRIRIAVHYARGNILWNTIQDKKIEAYVGNAAKKLLVAFLAKAAVHAITFWMLRNSSAIIILMLINSMVYLSKETQLAFLMLFDFEQWFTERSVSSSLISFGHPISLSNGESFVSDS